jgi:ABC transport system ATP-binding/permease protein
VAHLLGAHQISLQYPTKVVLDNVTVGINDGDRIGVVGRNGDGKSTLIRILAQRIQPDSGSVTARGGLRVGILDQSDTIPEDQSVAFSVVGTQDDHEWAGDYRIRDVITGLLTDVPWTAMVGELSGGQRRRVSLAALLVGEWDVIFLDEPTNHLDVAGVAWLANHLNNRWSGANGGLVVVTHDRWFLDAATTSTWEVHDRMVDFYEGGYAAYILQRVERDRSSQASEVRRQNLLRKELAWLRRGAPARTTKPKFRIDAANVLISNVPEIRDPVTLAKMSSQRLGKKVIELEDVSVTIEGATILHPLTWRLAPGERTGILGINGAGKTTLIKLIEGTLLPTTGRVSRGATVKLAVLDQRLASLDEIRNDRVSEVIARKRTTYHSAGGDLTPAQLLERLGFTSAHLSARVFELSGGQRRRLQLLLQLLEEPNVLLLDEPTNDLDTDMLAAMEDLLDTWPGTLVVVSHDRYLMERVTDQQYAIIDGVFRHLPQGVDQYLQLQHDRSPASVADLAGHGVSADAATLSAKEPGLRPGSNEHRVAQKEHASLGRKMGTIAAKIEDLDQALLAADHADHENLKELSGSRQALEAEMTSMESRWLELADILG